MKTNLFVIMALSFTLLGCKKIWMKDNLGNSPFEVYDEVWTEINENYVFFDSKNVDWAQVRSEYLNQVQPEMSEEELFDLLSRVLSELKDGHVSLFSGFNTYLYNGFYIDEPSNFNQNFIEQQYLQQADRIGPFLCEIFAEDIGYIYYDSFGKDFTEEELEYLLNYNKNTKGLIIDIRDNLGGALDNVTLLTSVFIDEENHFGTLYSPSKESNNLDDLQKISVQPFESNNRYTKPIVLLTNRKCYSSCNLFAGFMSVLPNVTVVGDTTGGGAGMAVAYELANGWRIRYPAGKVTLADGSELEEGVAPDIFISTGAEEEQIGEDALIEKAISILQ